MIDTKVFIDKLQNLTRKYQSSFETGSALTDYINLAQNELAEYLYSIYEINQRALDVLGPIIVTVPLVSDSTGKLTLPADYNHRLDLLYIKGSKEHNTHYIGTNQVGIIERIPQRRGDLNKNRVNYTFRNKAIQLFPKEALDMLLTYVKYPAQAKVAYTYSVTAGEDIRTYDVANSVNMEWDENVSNLLLYMTLDKMGIPNKDELTKEYAQLGIAKEEIRPIN